MTIDHEGSPVFANDPGAASEPGTYPANLGSAGAAGGDAGASAKDKAKDVASAASGESSQVAHAAAAATKDVASQAKSQAQAVIGQSKDQIHSVVGQARSELKNQADSKGEQAAGALRTLSDQLTALSQGRPHDAGQLQGLLGEAQQKVQVYADKLQQSGPQGLVEDVTSFARRRPGAFLLVAGVAGFAVGRTVRAGAAAARDESAGSDAQSSYSSASHGTTPSYLAQPSSNELPPPEMVSTMPLADDMSFTGTTGDSTLLDPGFVTDPALDLP